MYLLYSDETNLEPRDFEFFIYGGIAIPGDNAKSLHDSIEKTRHKYDVPADCLLKFNPTPECLTHQQYINVKQSMIESAVSHGCRFFVSAILHNIATSPDDARRKEINRITYHYDCFLSRLNDYGLVLVDRFYDGQIDAHLREKFAIGLRGFPYTDPMRLARIIGFHYSAIGQSHFSSIVDIALGSFRYAVNVHARNDQKNMPAARKLLKLIEPLFLRNPYTNNVDEISLFFSPKVVDAPKYKDKYQSLKDFLYDNGITAGQEITNMRKY